MGDDIRIYGGGGGPGNEPSRRRAEALLRFRRGHRVGDLVQGTFLRLEPVPPGTAWVSLEGAALLAALPDALAALARRIAAGQGAGAMPTGVTEADFPIRRGQRCYFLLEALEPEPLLRMLAATEPAALAGEAAAARRQALRNLPLTQLAARYARQRSLLERALRQELWTDGDLGLPLPDALPPVPDAFSASGLPEEKPDPQSPEARYAAFISRDGHKESFAELESYRAALVENLRPHGLLNFFFTPWLRPAANSLELVFMRSGPGPSLGDCEPDKAAPRGKLGEDLLPEILALKATDAHSGFHRKI